MTSVSHSNEYKHLEELISGTAQDDREAFAALYCLTSAAVYSFALSVLKNTYDAEDVLQETFINIRYGAKTYKARGEPMAWIMVIAKNVCMRKFRATKREADLSEEDWIPYLEGQEGVSPEERILIAEVMKTLDDLERQVVLLHAVSGFKYREIAKFLDLPLSTVISKYNRSIKKLKKQLDCKE